MGCVDKASKIVALEVELKTQRDLASGIVFDLQCELDEEHKHGTTVDHELDFMTSKLSDSKLELGEMVEKFAGLEKEYVACVKEKEEKILQHAVLSKRVDALKILLKRTNDEVYRLRQYKGEFVCFSPFLTCKPIYFVFSSQRYWMDRWPLPSMLKNAPLETTNPVARLPHWMTQTLSI